VDYVFRSNILALEDAIRFPETQIGGLSVLLDMAGVGFAHARYLSPHLAKKTVEVVQESFPMRFKAFHVLNEPFYFDAILAVLKPFLKDKIRRRVSGDQTCSGRLVCISMVFLLVQSLVNSVGNLENRQSE
jgi:CRAL/TRIO domain